MLAQKYKTERLRPRPSSPFITPKDDQSTSMDSPHPVAKSPSKDGGSPNFKIFLTEYEDDLIRQVLLIYLFHFNSWCQLFRHYFHMMLSWKVYPNTSKLLTHILTDNLNFAVKSITSLWRVVMKKLGFSYKRTSKMRVSMDSTIFIAQRASYFRKLDGIHRSGHRYIISNSQFFFLFAF